MVKTEEPRVPPPTNQVNPKYALIAAGIAGIVLYLSFYPFRFQAIPGAHSALYQLISTWDFPPDPGHFVSNILLYIPLGFFLILAYQRISPRCILGVILAGAALSFGIELAQLYIISRDSEMTDVYANALGTLFGAAAGVVLQGVLRTPSALGEKTRPFVFVLLACWVGYRLSPYLPEFSPHNYAAAVRALFSGSFAAADLYRYTVTCCALCLMGAAALGKNGANFKIPGLILMVLLARTLIAGTVLSPAESAGTALGLLLWWSVLSRLRARAVLIAILFAGAVGLQALEPFTFRLPARRFGIIPFHAFLNAPIDSALRNFLEKTFLYGTLVWLMTRAGVTWIAATVSGGALVLGLRLAQVYLPGRSAEITDLVLLLLMAGVMRLMTEDRSVPHTE